MKFWFSYLSTLLLCLVASLLIVWFVNPFGQSANAISPLPSFLSLPFNKQVSTLQLWLPSIEKSAGSEKLLEISAQSALVFDLATEQTLFAKNADQRLPLASITKIMTAIIALENPQKPDRYLVKEADLVGENSMGLASGEEMSLEELLYGLILPSGNDAAETLASNYPGGRRAFITAMNDKAKALGLVDTNFTNPSGLEGDGNQYTTVQDLLVITRYGLKNPLFAKVVATFQYYIEENEYHKAFFLENETNLLTSYPGVKGVKTGYTPEAGLCLVTYLDYNGHELIGVLLGSSNRRLEMKDLLDYSLKKLGVTPPLHD